MGYWKQRKIEQDSLGYSYDGGKYVCAECFTDYALEEFVKQNASETKCSYCGRSAHQSIAADLEEVIKFILTGIRTEYGNPDNEGLSYESAEGGYQGEVLNSYDLLYDDYIEPFTESEDLRRDIHTAISSNLWCQKDFYRLRPEESLLWGWRQFSEQVKHHTRYVFLRLQVSEDQVDMDPDYIAPSEMLGRLHGVIKSLASLGLVRTLPKGEKIWRVRVHKPEETCDNVASCGAPSLDNAKTSNRMSPAGIPMFYGALDKDTPFRESHEKPSEDTRVATLSKWEVVGDLRFLDLTNLPSIPSIFDPDRINDRINIKFVRSFVREVIKPIEKDGREHIEYVPTQVFTEYIRHLYRDYQGNLLDGIIYPSSQLGVGSCCVLFLGQEGCAEKDEVINANLAKAKRLRLVSHTDKTIWPGRHIWQ